MTYGKHVAQDLADLSGKTVSNLRLGKLAERYSDAIKERKAGEKAKASEVRINAGDVDVLKRLVAQQIESCVDEVNASMPVISVFDALQVVKGRRELNNDLGLRALKGHLETAWKKDRNASINVESYLTLQEYYNRQYPKSRVAEVFRQLQDASYLTLPVGELMEVVAQIETQSDFDRLVKDYGLAGNKPHQKKAREFIVATLNGSTNPFDPRDEDLEGLSPQSVDYLQNLLGEGVEDPESMYGTEDFEWEEDHEGGCGRRDSSVRIRRCANLLRVLEAQMQDFAPEDLGATETDENIYAESDNQEVLDNISNIWEWVTYLSDSLEGVNQSIQDGDTAVQEYIAAEVVPPLEEQIGTLTTQFEESQRSLLDKAQQGVQNFGQGVQNVGQGVADYGKGVGQGLSQTFKDLGKGLKNTFTPGQQPAPATARRQAAISEHLVGAIEYLQKQAVIDEEDIIANLGDVNYIEYGGLLVVNTEYGPQGVYIEAADDDEGRWAIYRFDLDPPSDNDWFMDEDTLEDVGGFIGSSAEELHEMFMSGEVTERARAYEAVGAYNGYSNLDSYPLELDYKEVHEFFGEPIDEEVDDEFYDREGQVYDSEYDMDQNTKAAWDLIQDDDDLMTQAVAAYKHFDGVGSLEGVLTEKMTARGIEGFINWFQIENAMKDWGFVEKQGQLAGNPPDDEIIEGMAKAFFASSWADHVDEIQSSISNFNLDEYEISEALEVEVPHLPMGGDIMDVIPPVPEEAYHYARNYYMDIESSNDVDLSRFVPPGEDEYFEKDLFGHYLAMEIMGHGVGWSDDHEDHGLDIPYSAGEEWDLGLIDPNVETVINYLEDNGVRYEG